MTSLSGTCIVRLLVILLVHLCQDAVHARTLCEVQIYVTYMTDSLDTLDRFCYRIYDPDTYQYTPMWSTIVAMTNCPYIYMVHKWKAYWRIRPWDDKRFCYACRRRPRTPTVDTQYLHLCAQLSEYKGGFATYDVFTYIQFTTDDVTHTFLREVNYFYMPSKNKDTNFNNQHHIKFHYLRLFTIANYFDPETTLRLFPPSKYNCTATSDRPKIFHVWTNIKLNGSCDIERATGNDWRRYDIACVGFNYNIQDSNLHYKVSYSTSTSDEIVLYSGPQPTVTITFEGAMEAKLYFTNVSVSVTVTAARLKFTTDPWLLQIIPTLQGGCSIVPASGYQTFTYFSVVCDLYNIASDAMLNYTVYSNSSDAGIIDLYKGLGPVPPTHFHTVGDVSNNYTLNVYITVDWWRHSKVDFNIESDVLKIDPLHLQVLPDPTTSFESTTDILESLETVISDSGEFVVFDNMRTNGDSSGAAYLILTLSEGLNVDNITSSTTDRKDQRAHARESLSEYLKELSVNSSSSFELEVVTKSWNSLTAVTDEVNQKTVENAATAYSNVADNFQTQVLNTNVETAERLTGLILNGSTNLLDVQSPPANTSHEAMHTKKTVVRTIMTVVEKVADAVIDTITPDDPPRVYHTSKLDVIVFKSTPSDVLGRSMSQSKDFYGKELTGSFLLPNDTYFNDSLQERGNGLDIGVQWLFYGHNPFEWDETAESVTTPVLDLKLKKGNHEEINITGQLQPIHFGFSTDKTESSKLFTTKITVKYDDSDILNYTIRQENAIVISMVSSIDDVVILGVTPNDIKSRDISFNVYSSRDHYPTVDLVTEYGKSLDKGNNFTVVDLLAGFNASLNTTNILTTHIILPRRSNEADDYLKQMLEPCSDEICTSEITIAFSIEAYKASCLFWDKILDKWSSHGCQISASTTVSSVHCDCNHLTAFAGSMLVLPTSVNPITDAALFLTFFSNPIVVTTVIVIWLIYFLLVCWAWKMDRHDLEKSGLILLGDNNPSDNYMYLVCVVTSWWRNAGTTASVSMYIQGEQGHSGKHCLKSTATDSDHILSSGAEDWFVLNTANSLGHLQSIYIWHDNKGRSPSWSLSRIIVKDVQSDETWLFPYDSWVAVNMGSMSTHVLLPAKTEEEVAAKGHKEFLFKSSNDLRDGHLWISIVSKPMKSTFTRVQRLSCALSLLFTMMLTNIMFHGIPTDNPEDQRKLGEISFSLSDIVIGIESAVIMFPINFLIIQIFTKIGPRPMTPTKDITYVPITKQTLSRSNVKSQEELEQMATEEKEGKLLPWWAIYIGWFLVILTSLVSSYFVMLYGLKYGPRKSVDFLISFFTAFFQSAFVTQPLKVIGLAIVVTMILKKPLRMNISRKRTTEVKKEAIGESVTHSIPNRLTSKMTKVVKKQTWLDEEARATLKDVGLYCVYIGIVLVIVHGHRSVSELHNVTNVLENMLITSDDETIAFHKVAVSTDIWAYHDKISPVLVNMANQSDSALYLVGPYRIRQLRVQEEFCLIQELLRKKHSFNVHGCHSSYWMGNEDTKSYNMSWSRPLPVRAADTQWSYRSAWELTTIPFIGKLTTYGGGGYVAVLKPNSVSNKLAEIEPSQWIDERTRAIFIEFTVYNPNRNIFSAVILLFEFSNIGAIVPYYQIFTAKLYNYGSELEIFVAVCEVLFILFNIVFTYTEIQEFRTIGRKRYLQEFWNYVELFQLALSYSAIVLFFQRLFAVSNVIDKMKTSDGSHFLSFYPTVILDYILMYITAFLTGLVIMKLFKFLKFNKRLYTIASSFGNAKEKLICYIIFSGIVMVAFAHFALLVFGKSLYDYKNFEQCIISLFNFLFGVSDLESLTMADRVLGPLFFVTFLLSFNIGMIALLISILQHTVRDLRRKQNESNDDFEVVDYIYSRLRNLF